MKNKTCFFLVPSIRFGFVILFAVLLTTIAIYISCLEHILFKKLRPAMIVKSADIELKLENIDFTPEPGNILQQSEYDRFLQRQDILARLLKSESVQLISDNTTSHLIPHRKSIADLSWLFWIQVAVSLGAILISGWIWSLKPKNLETNLFFLSGLTVSFSTLTSAVYTTRFLALPKLLFIILNLINAFTVPVFATVMIALFLIYPKKVKHWKFFLMAISIILFTWTFACVKQWGFKFSDINIIIVFSFLLLAACVGVQIFLTKNDPKSRAILLWLGLSTFVGTGFFALFCTAPVLLGSQPLEQGYAFISFLFIYLGLALGLKQYRLFEVGNWAYRFLFYGVGALLFIVLEIAFIFLINVDRFPALGLSLAFVSFCYLPLRDYFWRKLRYRKELPAHELLAEAVQVAFAPTSAIRLQRWEDLIKKLFDPLEMHYFKSSSQKVELESDGSTLILPSVAGIPALRLAYPWSGRSLFDPRALETAQQIVTFIEKAETSRQAYDRGVVEERNRIAQDLHDDVGARLLTGLHAQNSDLRSTIQGAMTDIRGIIKGITQESLLLSDLIADLRSESQIRLQAVKIDVNWVISDEKKFHQNINYHLHKTITSVVREIVSNTIKHSRAKKFNLEIEIHENALEIKTSDDGQGFPVEVIEGKMGYGLRGLQKRINDIGGSFRFCNSPRAFISIVFPVV